MQQLFERQCSRVYRVAMVYLKNASDAEDAVQSIFLKCMEKDLEFSSQSHENAWFVTVTRNYCKDLLKSFWRRHVEIGELPEQMKENETRNELTEKMLRLPIKYREVLYLYYYEEYSIREMSGILNRKESTIQTQLATARKKLKMEIEKEENCYGQKAGQECV